MKHIKNRRAPLATALFPFRENTDEPHYERRKTTVSQAETLAAEERQLLFSEMPAPIGDIFPDSDKD